MVPKIQRLQNIIPYCILAVAIFSVLPYPNSTANFITSINNTFFWWIVQILILYIFFRSNKYFFNKDQKGIMIWVKLYLIWNGISVFRGFFIAETYWDWKWLFENTMSFMIPIVAYTGTNVLVMQNSLRFFLRYGLLVFAFLAFFLITGAYGFYLVPIGFLTLFLPFIKKPWRWIVLAIAVFVIFADLTNRSNVIKYVVPILFSFLYYFRFMLSTAVFELVRKLLIVTPIFFFVLGVNGIFNIFKINEYVKGDYVEIRVDEKGQRIEEDLTADSRTFIYEEVLKTAKVYDSWWIGRSPARGNISETFGEQDLNKRGERMGNEMAIANIFNWTGLLGVVFYLIAFYKASYLAVNKSNNVFSKILGLFVAFRWLYAWVEDANNFSITTFFLWIMIGMCFSESFRKMNNKEVKIWVQGIFEKPKRVTKKMRYNHLLYKNL